MRPVARLPPRRVDVDAARVADRRVALVGVVVGVRRAHRQRGAPAALEAAEGESAAQVVPAEDVVVQRDVGDVGVEREADAAVALVQVGGAGIRLLAQRRLLGDVVAHRADGQVVESVAVEVAGRERLAEAVVGLHGVVGLRRLLVEVLRDAGRPRVVVVGQEQEGTGVVGAAVLVARRAGDDLQRGVVGQVPEIADRQAPTQLQRRVLQPAGVVARVPGPGVGGGQADRRSVQDVEAPGLRDAVHGGARGADHQVIVAVLVQVAGGQPLREPAAGRAHGAAERSGLEHDGARGMQAARAAAADHRDDAGAAVLADRTDRQVVVAVAVEIAGRQREAEVVVGFRERRRVGLGQHEAGRQLDAVREPVVDPDAARIDDGADIVVRQAHRQVVEAVAVEVADRQRIAELDRVVQGRARAEQRGAQVPQAAHRPPVDGDHAVRGGGHQPVGLPGGGHGQIVAAVTVEVAGSQRVAEQVAGVGDLGRLDALAQQGQVRACRRGGDRHEQAGDEQAGGGPADGLAPHTRVRSGRHGVSSSGQGEHDPAKV